MDRKIIKEWVVNKRSTMIDLEGIWVSSFIPSPRSKNKVINIIPFRKRRLSHPSSLERKFKKWIDTKRNTSQLYNYTQEFPIPIINQELWRKLCTERNITEDKVVNKSAFFIDYFLPQLRLAIELDGEQHTEITQSKSDSARDVYLKEMYGISILRLPDFGRVTNEFLTQLELTQAKILTSPLFSKPFNQDEEAMWCFEEVKENELYVMEILTTRYAAVVGDIELSDLDFYKVTQGKLWGCSIEDFNKLFYGMFQKKVIIIDNP